MTQHAQPGPAPTVGLAPFLRENGRWLGAGMVMSLLSSFGQTFFISVFAEELRGEFGLTHSAWGSSYALGTAVSAAVMIWAGGLTDRFRSRTIATVVLLALAASCLFMAMNQAVWALPAVIFCLRLTGQGMMSHVALVSMARWFASNRGKALMMAGLGFALGEAVLPMTVIWLKAWMPWRGVWMMAAGAALLTILPLRVLLAKERTPQSHVKASQSTGMLGRSWSRAEALRHWLFWLAVPALLGPPAFNTAFFFQQVEFAGLKGWSHLELAALFPVYSGISVAALVGSGLLLDKLGVARLIQWYQVPYVLAFVAFSQLGSLPGAAVGLAMMAASAGAHNTLTSAFWAEYFGTAHLGAIKAAAAALMVLGSAIGPGLSGLLLDRGVSLATQYLWVAGYFAFAVACLATGVARAQRYR